MVFIVEADVERNIVALTVVRVGGLERLVRIVLRNPPGAQGVQTDGEYARKEKIHEAFGSVKVGQQRSKTQIRNPV